MSEVLVFTPRAEETTLPNPWLRLPAGLAAITADPIDWGRVHSAGESDSRDLWENVATAARLGNLQLTAAEPLSTPPTLPSLAPSDRPGPAWLRAAVDECGTLTGGPVQSKIDLIALQAGLLQMTGDLTASHEHSQSIEGRGKQRAGDYWHAINHRREPDDGNAKYWFRQVGNHPLLTELGQIVPALADGFSPAVREQGLSLVERGRLEPFRFVDLASQARRRRDEELTAFAERLQWVEMVLLLESTRRDAFG
ncbi:hypothetical protein Pan44_27590 [Caulifigura coniformis]|uniref:Uncharacterized protein n=1 Tax=Caulifigura coniformis TaxID=2527983 RepID=A0A517SF04_9PLAN|nr:hypothetical protein [Caulifigura coniformis]QDT54724.1 hypothetical protein Pan44_27590 [Caulifigura coniformis]